ncbi:hypothetical protein KUW19_17585 [Ferrimonas balearica]|uniref:hypothetical protein n=1 Tax=Ferrimonas balearica TaxID=44012 RepID=UPI001C98B233|nr:hypothetical protein [Ferrimonas balearica]MBY6108276.1 hypothetical protein [Ferrimonas balearica]
MVDPSGIVHGLNINEFKRALEACRASGLQGEADFFENTFHRLKTKMNNLCDNLDNAHKSSERFLELTNQSNRQLKRELKKNKIIEPKLQDSMALNAKLQASLGAPVKHSEFYKVVDEVIQGTPYRSLQGRAAARDVLRKADAISQERNIATPDNEEYALKVIRKLIYKHLGIK